MHENLNRVESAIAATANGDLTWDRWPLDYAVALGWAGKANPLGFALVRFREAQDHGRGATALVWEVVLKLQTVLERQEKAAAIAAKDAAWKALDIWNDSRCSTCQGRGVINIEQATCRSCNGTGRRQMDGQSELVKAAVSALVEAESRMEGQLARAMKDAVVRPSGDGCRVNLPAKDSQSDQGFNRSPRTPIRSHNDKGG